MAADEGLKREIGVWGLVANAMNIVIGAGIFILPVAVAEKLGSWSIMAYLVCGLLMILIMLCFAEVGSMITKTGGVYSYIETAFGRFAGFMTTNIFIFGASIMANAAVANGLADTLGYFFPVFHQQIVRVAFFALIFGGLAYFNIRGVRDAIFIVKLNTVAKLVPLVIVALGGWFFFHGGYGGNVKSVALDDIGQIALLLLFAFVGAETALNVGGEIKSPEKTIPKGIMISIIAVVVIYALIQVTVQGVLGASISEFSTTPLAEVGRRMLGPLGATIVITGASFSMFGNISGMVLNMPRILYAVARDGVVFPRVLARIHPVHRTPYVSVLVYALLGFIFATTGEFKQLAMLSSASYLIIYLGVVLALIKFRYSEFPEKPAYRIPGGLIIPTVSVITILWLLSKLPVRELTGMIIFMLIIGVFYFAISFFNKKK